MKLEWEFYRDKRGQWRWRAWYDNGRIAGASSQGYSRKDDCIKNALDFGYRL